MGIVHPVRFARFGPFQLDLHAGELRRNGARVRVPDQSLAVLTMLVEKSGEIVTREELHRKLWPNGTIVEFDNSINSTIRRLREALEDSAQWPQFIETVPRRGYRFIGAVEEAVHPETASASDPDPGAGGLAGQTISRYRVVRRLGQGAMGVVYEAEDGRLGRSVALKFLPEELSDDRRALERFEREARAASALNHPNICTVYEVDEHEGVRFIAMEYVAGKSLDQLIAPEGLPLNEVLSYAVQIVDALAKAHSAGIVHRDLKPSNIMVRQDGLVKLLDFGLAKVRAAAPSMDLTAPPAATPLTGEGTILGTLQYMAPEQLEGREADARTDIFAFGAVIYEMATGRKAFEGKSQASLIAAILEREPPPISSLRPSTAPALDRLVATCLAKKPDDRWQSVRDLLRELKWMSEGKKQFLVVPARPQRRQLLRWSALAALSLAVAVLATVQFRQRPSEVQVIRYEIPLPDKVRLRSWDIPTISPNGQKLVFTGVGSDGKRRLWFRSLDSTSTYALPGTEDAFTPFWSPDSRFVAFYSGSPIKKIDPTGGGLPVTLCDLNGMKWFGGGTWSQNGVILFSAGTQGDHNPQLYRVPDEGGAMTPAGRFDKARHEKLQWCPHFLPDGRHFVYWSGTIEPERASICLGSLDSFETRSLISAQSNVTYAPPGFLIYGDQETLLAQPFDLKKLELKGRPITVAQPVAHAPDNPISLFSTSNNGVLVYGSPSWRKYQLAWHRRDGTRERAVGEPVIFGGLALSPDEKRAAMFRPTPPLGTYDIWILNLTSGVFSRVTTNPDDDAAPVWSADGHELIFSSLRTGELRLFRKVVGGGDEELLLNSEKDEFARKFARQVAQQWLTDGSIIFTSTAGPDPTAFYLWPRAEGRKPLLLLKTEFFKGSPEVSRDGRWVAYQSTESGRLEVYIAAFPTFTEKRQVSGDGGREAHWRSDGKELFYLSLDGKVMSVEVNSTTEFESGAPTMLFQTPMQEGEYCVTGDGKRFLIGEPVEEVSKPLTVVHNWTAGLQR